MCNLRRGDTKSDKKLYERLGGYGQFFLALLSTINCDGFGVIGGKTVPSEKIASRRFSMRYVGRLLVVYGAKHDIRSKGLRIDEEDWTRVGGHLAATLDSFNVPTKEKS